MSSPFLWENYFRKDPKHDLLELLKQVPLFADLSRQQRKFIAGILHRRMYQAGEYVFHEGEPGLGMYIIEDGRVSIVYGKDNTEIASLTNGEFFGELALAGDQPRPASAVALVDTKLYGFFHPDLIALINRHPRIGTSILMKLVSVLSERLYRAILDNKRLHLILEMRNQEAE